MYLSRLTLQNYRNYAHLELELSPGSSLFAGDNAQGKTNLLEAIYLLATTRSPRSSNDGDLVRWEAAASGAPVARIEGRALRRRGEVEVTIAIGLARQQEMADAQRSHVSKRLQVNGVAKRASDVVGQIAAVLFTAQDIELLTGPPALRRRYLDITISQVNPLYLRSLQRYSRILLQRNSLLRRLQDGGRPDQLGFWDQEFSREAALIFTTRAAAISWLATRAMDAHARLSGANESLSIAYQPQLPPGTETDALSLPANELRGRLLAALGSAQRREIAAGMSLFGPHRDEVLFAVNGGAAASFGSRAQQRTAALALRLAETGYIEAEAGDKPVLLLDDILSELDERRRQSVLETLGGVDQLLVTATEVDRLAAGALASAHQFRVHAGEVREG